MLSFVKYQALGNDFLLLDGRAGGGLSLDAKAARRLCDRHFGVGADGVIILISSERADVGMHIYNTDGSEPGMCGNGLRCLVKYALDHGKVPDPRGSEVAVELQDRVHRCLAFPGADGKVAEVEVEMGAPILERQRIPMQGGEGRCIEEPLEVAGQTFKVTCLSMGNPHAIIFPTPDEVGGEVDSVMLGDIAQLLGPSIELHPWFPERSNVGFAAVRSPDEIELVVWERGCGLTLACGSGACAAVVAAAITNRVGWDQKITVRLPGGPLTVTAAADLSGVTLRGPAVEVFRGEVEIELPARRPIPPGSSNTGGFQRLGR